MNKILSMVFLLFGFLLFLNFGYSDCEPYPSGGALTIGPNFSDNCTIRTSDFRNLSKTYNLLLNDLTKLTIIHDDYFDVNINLLDENFIGKTIFIWSLANNSGGPFNLNIKKYNLSILGKSGNWFNVYDNVISGTFNKNEALIDLNYNLILSNVMNYNNLNIDLNLNSFTKLKILDSKNITINGFDYNNINTLNLPQNTNMISIKDSEYITIQNFRLYSINGIRNNNLTYLDVNNSNAIIVNNNVFNDVNNALRFQDVNSLIISNSFFNVRKIFDNIDFKNSEIIFANNFLSTIYNLDNISSNIITLQTQDTNSVGPVLNNVNNTYNCIVNTLVTDYNRTIPMYYFANNKYVKTEHIPPCWGGNLYANKTLPEFCGNDCFNVLEEYSNNPVDLISNNIESIQNINISDKAPLLLRKEIYENITEISDLYLIMNINPIDKKELYNPNDDYNFQILIKPNPIEQEGFLLYNDLNFYFEEVIINNNIRIVLNELYDSSRTLICEFGGSCKLNLNFQALFEDLNFNLKEFEKISSGNVTVPIKLTYTKSVGGAYCLWKPESRHCKPSHNILSGIIIIPIEGSAPTIKTPDNNVWVVALLSISIIGIYLFGSRIKKSKKK